MERYLCESLYNTLQKGYLQSFTGTYTKKGLSELFMFLTKILFLHFFLMHVYLDHISSRGSIHKYIIYTSDHISSRGSIHKYIIYTWTTSLLEVPSTNIQYIYLDHISSRGSIHKSIYLDHISSRGSIHKYMRFWN